MLDRPITNVRLMSRNQFMKYPCLFVTLKLSAPCILALDFPNTFSWTGFLWKPWWLCKQLTNLFMLTLLDSGSKNKTSSSWIHTSSLVSKDSTRKWHFTFTIFPTWIKSSPNANMNCRLFGTIPPCDSCATTCQTLSVQFLPTPFFILTHPLESSCSPPSPKVLELLWHIGCSSMSRFSDPPPIKTDALFLGYTGVSFASSKNCSSVY